MLQTKFMLTLVSLQANMDSMFRSNRVKELLEEQGRTRKWLARACGLEPLSLNHILAGRRQPGLPVLKLMAIAFNISERELTEKPSVEVNSTGA